MLSEQMKKIPASSTIKSEAETEKVVRRGKKPNQKKGTTG